MKISIVIPTVNEEASLPQLLAQLFSGDAQVVVADGGSTDGTLKSARRFPVEIVQSPVGRAKQMNCGAVRASGDVLWFLHADTAVPSDWHRQIVSAMGDPTVMGGGFSVRIDAHGIRYRFLDAWGAFRTRMQRSFYGDQGIFVRRWAFEALGGFADGVPEDLDFSTRFSRLGKVVILPGPLKTSARCWQTQGWWCTVWQHSRIALSYGVRHQLNFLKDGAVSDTTLVTVIIMAKAPVPGKVKTRLIPHLTAEQAAALAAGLLRDTALLIENLPGVQPAIAVEPPSGMDVVRKLVSRSIRLIPQGDGDLGKRIVEVFRQEFSRGACGTIALGADHPNLPAEYVRQAVRILQCGIDPVVLGPTEDGGYYLIGMKRLHPELFEGISWSSSQVLEETKEQAKKAGLLVILLPPWHDIDRPEDLAHLE